MIVIQQFLRSNFKLSFSQDWKFSDRVTGKEICPSIFLIKDKVFTWLILNAETATQRKCHGSHAGS